MFRDIITAHVWLAKFSLRICICKGTIARRDAIKESEDELQEVLMELRAMNAGDKKVLQEPTAEQTPAFPDVIQISGI